MRAHQVGVADRKAIIDKNHPLSIARQAELLDISRSTVYCLPRQTSNTDRQDVGTLMKKMGIESTAQKAGTYKSRDR